LICLAERGPNRGDFIRRHVPLLPKGDEPLDFR
jgi:hypothetical protein